MPSASDPRVLSHLPGSYVIEREEGAFAAVHESAVLALEQVGWGAARNPVLRTSRLRGRRPLLELETRDEVLLVRRFSHGGLLRWATGRRFLDPERPFREIQLSDFLRTRGIDSPLVVAARASRARSGWGWHLEVLTRRVPGASDLGIQLAELQRGKLAEPARGRLLRAVGRLVAHMHRVGFLHADLNPNNLLVELATLADPEPRLWVLDLDRSRTLDSLTSEQRWKNLGRLFRHVARRESERGAALRRSDYRRVLAGYDPDRACWKEAWRAIETERRASRWHRLGWTLERIFGQVDPRR